MAQGSLTVKDLHKSFANGKQELVVLRGVTVNFEPQASFAIMGASGSGKSTFMHILAGLDTPSSGAVYFNGVDIHAMDHKRRTLFLQQSIGLVFQLPYLIKELSVLENVIIRGLIAGLDAQETKSRADYFLDLMGLSDKKLSNPAQLSGGQQQRVALARAMMTKPSFLLADEPTGNLDEHTGNGIVDLLMACQQEWGMTIIVSTHDRYLANRMKYVYRLKDGLLHEDQESSGKS